MSYQVICADPPWNVKAGPSPGRYVVEDGGQVWDRRSLPSRDLPYSTMSVGDICRLPVAELAADNAHLYLWTINKYVDEAFDVARAWGFRYSTLLTWSKKPMGGGLGGCYGISSEYVLFCRRGSHAASSRITGTVFNWKRPYDERGKPRHSAKPPEFYKMVENVSPGSRLELFAREPRPGWHVWGNEVESGVVMASTYSPEASQVRKS